MAHSMCSDFEHREDLVVQVGDAARAERDVVLRAVAGADAQHVRDEVELHVEPAVAVRDRPRS